jgi:hypothetical protein
MKTLFEEFFTVVSHWCGTSLFFFLNRNRIQIRIDPNRNHIQVRIDPNRNRIQIRIDPNRDRIQIRIEDILFNELELHMYSTVYKEAVLRS